MRLASHTVVFDRDPDFARYSKDPSGSVIRIVHLWLAEAGQGRPTIRHYLGSVRRCDCGGWVSRCELARLFRRATVAARLAGDVRVIWSIGIKITRNNWLHRSLSPHLYDGIIVPSLSLK